MKKAGKTLIKIATFSLIAVTLVACGQPDISEENHKYIEPVYEEKAVFIEKFDNKHIDVSVGDTKKMYAVPSSLKNVLKEMKPNDVILIEYTLDNELKRNVKNITIEGKTKTVVKDEKETGKKEEKKEEIETLKVFTNGNWVEEEAKLVKNSAYTLKILPEFKATDNKIVSTNNESYYVSMEELPLNAEIKPLRWNASDELKKIGELKELKGEKIYDPNFRESEFVFTARNGEIAKNFVIRKEDGRLIRYIMVFPSNEENNTIESRLWAMMNGIEYN